MMADERDGRIASNWLCARCGQAFRSFDVPRLTAERKLVHPDRCPDNLHLLNDDQLQLRGQQNNDRFTTKVGETHPDWSGDPVQPPSRMRVLDGQLLSELVERWYQIAANEAAHSYTRRAYRECANQLDDLLGTS